MLTSKISPPNNNLFTSTPRIRVHQHNFFGPVNLSAIPYLAKALANLSYLAFDSHLSVQKLVAEMDPSAARGRGAGGGARGRGRSRGGRDR